LFQVAFGTVERVIHALTAQVKLESRRIDPWDGSATGGYRSRLRWNVVFFKRLNPALDLVGLGAHTQSANLQLKILTVHTAHHSFSAEFAYKHSVAHFEGSTETFGFWLPVLFTEILFLLLLNYLEFLFNFG